MSASTAACYDRANRDCCHHLSRYREALPYRASDVELHGRLGMAFARMDRLDESQAEFETILRLNPNDQVAKQAVEAIQARKKSLGK